jgi:ribosome maturation factor RimP
LTPVERVRELAARVAESYGLLIDEVVMRREGGSDVLRVILDRPGSGATPEESVSITDCERVSQELSTILDVEDLLPESYTLEVSSPGLDRPLRDARDYVRFAGRSIGRPRFRDAYAASRETTCCSRTRAAS